MKILVCIDGLRAWLLCNVIGPFDGTFTLNPTTWGTDILSIQPDGSIQHRPTGTNGSFEQFHVSADFVFVNPNSAQSPNNCLYGFKFVGA